LRANKIEPNFPAYMQRGGCFFCPFKSKKEFAAMVHLVPNEIEKVRILEENVQDKRNKYFRIRQNMPKMAEFIAIEKKQPFWRHVRVLHRFRRTIFMRRILS